MASYEDSILFQSYCAQNEEQQTDYFTEAAINGIIPPVSIRHISLERLQGDLGTVQPSSNFRQESRNTPQEELNDPGRLEEIRNLTCLSQPEGLQASAVPSMVYTHALQLKDNQASAVPPGRRENASYLPTPIEQDYYSEVNRSMRFSVDPYPLNPSGFRSDHDTPYCGASPQPVPVAALAPVTRINTASERRRAQNRASQRVFRERKEKQLRDLQSENAAFTEKYQVLQASHRELNANYHRLRMSLRLLAADDNVEGKKELWKLLGSLDGESNEVTMDMSGAR